MQPSPQPAAASESARRSGPPTRGDYDFFEPITLRYADNDANGHVNNAHYYSFFDTGVEGYLRQYNLRDVLSGTIRTLVVASSCRYFSEVAFPGQIDIGVKITRVGNSSIQYDIGVFRKDGSTLAAASGTFTVVCACPVSGRPVTVPEAFRHHFQATQTQT